MEPEQVLEKEQKVGKKIVLLVLGVLMLVVAGIYFFVRSMGSDSGGDSDSISTVSMIPIWTAVFVPIIAARKNDQAEKEVLNAREKKLVYALIAGTAAVVLLSGLVMMFFK